MAMIGSLMQNQGRPMGALPAGPGAQQAAAAAAAAAAAQRQKQPPAGALTCMKHKKVRGPNNVEETYPGSREFHCKVGSECKVSEAIVQRNDGPVPPGNVTCVIHGKLRGPNNVEPTYPGSQSWKCKAGSECKIPAAMKPNDGNAPAGPVTCVVHGKQRGPNNVEETYQGSRQYRCRPGSECKLPANNDMKADGQQGMYGQAGDAGAHFGDDQQTCSVHGKLRGPNNVMRLPNGQFQCKPGSECKMPSNTEAEVAQEEAGMYGHPAPIHPEGPALCWAHQKKRSPNQLHQVNTPLGAQWECLPQYKCKGSSGQPATAAALSSLQSTAATGGSPFPMPSALQTHIPDTMGQAYALPQHLLTMPPQMGMMQLGAQLGHH